MESAGCGLRENDLGTEGLRGHVGGVSVDSDWARRVCTGGVAAGGAVAEKGQRKGYGVRN